MGGCPRCLRPGSRHRGISLHGYCEGYSRCNQSHNITEVRTMSDKTPKAPAAPSTLGATIVKSLATALRDGIQSARNSGTALSDFLAACVGQKLATAVLPADVDAIVNAAYPDGASDPKVLKVRRSEARNIVRAHATLPEGIT